MQLQPFTSFTIPRFKTQYGIITYWRIKCILRGVHSIILHTPLPYPNQLMFVLTFI